MMIKFWIITFCWLSLLSSVYVIDDENISDEHRLFNDLFRTYNTDIRPVRNINNTVNISLIFSLQHLDDLDAQKQLLRVSGWLEVEWFDEYMAWNESDYGGVHTIVVPPNRVWLPSFALENSAGDVYDLKHYSFFRTTIWSDGTVLWEPGGKYECVCTMDIAYYPFDYQVCQLVFANWAYEGHQVDLYPEETEINMEKFPGNGEWNIVRTEAVKHEETYFCCPGIVYPEIHFIMYMQRKSLYYVINVLLPVLLLSLLELLVFILPCESGEKVSLGITIMLGFSVFSLLIEESVPNSSESTPIIVIYLTCAMGAAAVSIICAVCILAIHYHDLKVKPPKWLIRFADITACNLSFNIGTLNNNQQSDGKLIRKGSVLDFLPAISSTIKPYGDEISPSLNKSEGHRPEEKSSSVTTYLKQMMAMLHQKNESDNISKEWKAVAKALDRFLFKIVASMLLIMAIIILGFMPLAKTWPVIDIAY